MVAAASICNFFGINGLRTHEFPSCCAPRWFRRCGGSRAAIQASGALRMIQQDEARPVIVLQTLKKKAKHPFLRRVDFVAANAHYLVLWDYGTMTPT